MLLNRQSAISGVGGAVSSAPGSANDGLAVDALQTIMCDWHSSHLTLRGEFGIWDARTRFDLLLLFQFPKLVFCARGSAHFRTLYPSAGSLTHARSITGSAASKDWHKGCIYQSGIQQVLAAAVRFCVAVSLNDF